MVLQSYTNLPQPNPFVAHFKSHVSRFYCPTCNAYVSFVLGLILENKLCILWRKKRKLQAKVYCAYLNVKACNLQKVQKKGNSFLSWKWTLTNVCSVNIIFSERNIICILAIMSFCPTNTKYLCSFFYIWCWIHVW